MRRDAWNLSAILGCLLCSNVQASVQLLDFTQTQTASSVSEFCSNFHTRIAPCRDVNTALSALTCSEESFCCDALTQLEISGCFCEASMTQDLADAFIRCTAKSPDCVDLSKHKERGSLPRYEERKSKQSPQAWSVTQMKISMDAFSQEFSRGGHNSEATAHTSLRVVYHG